MKIGYSLITKTKALWVQILRAKYSFHERFSDSIIQNRCSYIWKAIAKAWPLLHNNMIWSTGNGRYVRCWEDNWVPNVGPLNQYVPSQDNGDWNLDLFRLWLPEEVVHRIISILPPSELVGPDILSWSRIMAGGVIRDAEESGS
ncbi:hypothetical protein J1N35_043268 [Gossypium stocksii]|uniref:Reverse transcriptase zinc-binding domain-containing protein n=1 Tax=Gossypium stocksii TaxID=47602 RepID=A0A9D3U701_9ROSI|nr:hypothetical protein J1N35_043268 [Gossypium stocksii]